MPNQWDDETKRKIAEGQKGAYERGERKAPVTVYKEKWVDTQARLDKMEKELAEMRAELAETRTQLETVTKHRDQLEKTRQKDGFVWRVLHHINEILSKLPNRYALRTRLGRLMGRSS
jgi:hypothetical protein